jgi:hypothetical protein
MPTMKEDAENKARRRRSIREAFPAPLNQIALRHVDTVQSLDVNRKAILAEALAKVGVAHIAACLAAIKSSGNSIKSESDLIANLNISEIPIAAISTDNVVASTDPESVEEIDTDYLASLLIKCYPDMPQATADALVGSEVMTLSLQVVSTTRLALGDAKSDFVITALYTLFEEKLDEIEQVIANNHAFVKAMQLSRPDWKPN